MVWVKLDDKYAEHPKIAAAGPLAELLWIRSLAYCNRNLTDGFIPYSVAATLVSWRFLDPFHELDDGRRAMVDVGMTSGMSGDDVDCEALFPYLTNAGLWVQVPGGFRVHDFLDHQPSKAEIEKEREEARNRMRRVRGQPVDNIGRSSDEVQPNTDANIGRSSPNPVPVPVPVSTTPPSEEDSTGERIPIVPDSPDDARDLYAALTGSRPWGRPAGAWILRLQERHGQAQVEAALLVEHRTDSTLNTLLGRIEARLEKAADRVAEAKQREPKPVDPLREQLKAAVEARYGAEDAKPIVGTSPEGIAAGRAVVAALRASNGHTRGGASVAVGELLGLPGGGQDGAPASTLTDDGTAGSTQPSRDPGRSNPSSPGPAVRPSSSGPPTP